MCIEGLTRRLIPHLWRGQEASSSFFLFLSAEQWSASPQLKVSPRLHGQEKKQTNKKTCFKLKVVKNKYIKTMTYTVIMQKCTKWASSADTTGIKAMTLESGREKKEYETLMLGSTLISFVPLYSFKVETDTIPEHHACLLVWVLGERPSLMLRHFSHLTTDHLTSQRLSFLLSVGRQRAGHCCDTTIVGISPYHSSRLKCLLDAF